MNSRTPLLAIKSGGGDREVQNKIIGLLALMLVMSPAFAATVAMSESFGCGDTSETFTVTGAGFGQNNITNLTFDGVLGSTSTVALTACTVGTYANASVVNASALGAFACTVQVYTNDYGTHDLTMTDISATSVSNDFSVKCYEVTDLVSQGIDIAGKFMGEMVSQSGNIAALIILGLLVTLLVGIIAAVGGIFYVFKLK